MPDETKPIDNKKKDNNNKPTWRKLLLSMLAVLGEIFIGYELIQKGFDQQVGWSLLAIFATTSIFVGGNVAESYVSVAQAIFNRGKVEDKDDVVHK
jgi:hypothetical protein